MKPASYTIRRITASELPAIELLAREIWTEHYSPIIGILQAKYMINKFQSAEYMGKQINDEGFVYYAAFTGGEAGIDGEAVGYCAIQPNEDNGSIFLSKLYIKKEHRQHGLARTFIDVFVDEHKHMPVKKIFLTVNKNNSGSISAYKKMGFEIASEAITDIGNGFVMDDYVMERAL